MRLEIISTLRLAPSALLSWALITVLLLAAVPRAAAADAARATPGTLAPWFNLERLTGGTVSRENLRGKHAVLVVGRTREAAPPCKAWMVALRKQLSSAPHLYNVVITNNPWYIPHAAVRSKLREFVPPEAHHQILIDWGTRFEKDYAIIKNAIPTIFVLDAQGTILWRHHGTFEQSVVNEIKRRIQPSPA